MKLKPSDFGRDTRWKLLREATRQEKSRASKALRPKRVSELEESFAALWAKLGNGQEPVREYRFDSVRRFRLDFAWPDKKVGVECDGAIWTQGRHSRGSGVMGDIDKHNKLMLAGWRYLRITTGDLKRRPVEILEQVRCLLTLPE